MQIFENSPGHPNKPTPESVPPNRNPGGAAVIYAKLSQGRVSLCFQANILTLREFNNLSIKIYNYLEILLNFQSVKDLENFLKTPNLNWFFDKFWNF